MRALVTGVAGFVGSNLARRLIAEGVEVVGVDALTDYYDTEIKMRNLADLPRGGFRFERVRLQEADLEALLADVDVVFHQAGQPGVRKSWGGSFDPYLGDNILATQRLLEAAKGAGRVSRFVYASSSSVYGNAERYPTSEVDRPEPLSPYGVTKLAAEHLCSLYAKNYGVPTVSLRYFTVYGPRQRPDMAFSRFINAIRRGHPIEVYGTGQQVRDFTFIDDVVDANFRAGMLPLEPGAIFNVAGGSSASVLDVLDSLSEIAGTEPIVSYSDAMPGDAAQTGGDTDLIRMSLDWRPTVDLRSGLEAQVEWFDETNAIPRRGA